MELHHTLGRKREHVHFLVLAHDAPLIIARHEPLAHRVAVQPGLRKASWMQAEEQTRTMPRQHLSGALQHVQLRSFDVNLDEGRHELQIADFVVERRHQDGHSADLRRDQAVDPSGAGP